ncbi:MAG: hypothetical protein JSU83_20970 [Deltaproteobacteria bacterium]|nr:MAG: hypothetical protein JSU83_20970 [Deltaproteobacteria bacterium]
MFCVLEYGENIGTVRKLFPDMKKALCFAKQVMDHSGRVYRTAGKHKWFCIEKKEYLKIEKI